MKLLTLALTSLLFTACIDQDEPELGATESAATTTQGSFYNGSFYNGSFYNGSFYNGSFYNGSFYNGATYGGTTLTDAASVAGTTITIWRKIAVKTLNGVVTRWEMRQPSQTCTWDATRTQLIGCTQVNLSTTASPLTGVGFPASFTNPSTGNTVTGTMYIGGQSTTTLGAVASDSTTSAMHPLTGASNAPIIGYNSADASGTRCDNPNGCRINSDLWLYTIKLWDPNSQTLLDFCPSGARAIALGGVWDGTGKYTSSSTQFTFACTNGTIAKCTRWGYRRWTSASKSDGTGSGMAAYHQACVRAATADYCANGHSFTKNGTLVDVYDYQPHQTSTAGFIPRTVSVEYLQQHPTPNAFVWESTFDTEGATDLDFTRYVELGNVESICPGRFSLPTAPDPNQPYHIPYVRTAPAPAGTARVSIDNTVVCDHAEQTLGKWLHPTCSKCTQRLWDLYGLGYSCISPSGSWTSACRSTANSVCNTSYPKMAAHSECSTSSTPLNRYDSACTMRVCAANAACCVTSWGQACVDTANTQCVGGRENSLQAIGFCGTSVVSGNAP